MANENVKIIVQEVDETRPRGSGLSSDIVYIPGLCNDFVSPEYRNVPTLCSTVDDFEQKFGAFPYRFTDHYTAYDIHPGDCDKSYIYAKELLNAGLTVLYEAIVDDTNALTNIADFSTSDSRFCKVRNSKNVFGMDAYIDETETRTVPFEFNLSECNTVYGNVSVIAKAGSGVSSVSVESITPPSQSNFTVTDNTITWEYADEITSADLNRVFTANLVISGKGNFSVSLVSGDVGNEVSIQEYDGPVDYFYNNLASRLDNLSDKNEYTVKYITSGGYPSFVAVVQENGATDYTLANKMLSIAAERNDAVALIDHPNSPSEKLGIREGIYKKVNEHFRTSANGEFGAMFTPWADYSCVTMDNAADSLQCMPASFGYLLCLAYAIKTSPNWLAMAGVTRGIVPNLRRLNTDYVLSNVIAENYQPKYGTDENCISINAITNVKPYGLTIWGNRTLKKVDSRGTVATNFLNTRNMISDIKKLAYNTAKSLMFEQDSDTLWLSFKSGVSPLLDQLKSGSGISDYKLIKNTTKYNGKALTRGEMSAIIKIFPLYAIEYFEITVVVSDNDVAIS